jgi:hypothetical protein
MSSRTEREEAMGPRIMVGILLGLLGVLCALVGVFGFDGLSVELPGLILGLGYYFGLRSGNCTEQIYRLHVCPANRGSKLLDSYIGRRNLPMGTSIAYPAKLKAS